MKQLRKEITNELLKTYNKLEFCKKAIDLNLLNTEKPTAEFVIEKTLQLMVKTNEKLSKIMNKYEEKFAKIEKLIEEFENDGEKL